MIKDYIAVGVKLELKYIKTRENSLKNEKIYMSQLLDFSENDKASIAMPLEKGRLIPLAVGDKYIICFYTNKGLFQCTAIITDRFRNNNIYMLEIQFLSDLEKYQRRQFYRLECIMEITYHVISEAELILSNSLKESNVQNELDRNKYPEIYEDINAEWKQGTITDISGGGARFNSKQMHECGEIIQLGIEFGTSGGFKRYILQVIVIFSTKMTNHQGYFEHRVQFKDILKEEREAIIKYIFEEERRLRIKEKRLN